MRSRTFGALTVILSTCGCSKAGPNVPQTNLEHLRRDTEASLPPQIKLSYLQSAQDAHVTSTPVVYVHGTPGSAQAWANYVERPVDHTYSIALDRPGFGQSAPTRAFTSLREQAAAVLAVMPKDGQPVVLVGHSLGGPVVAQVAVEHSSRVKALVLVAASLDPGQEKIHPLQPLGTIWPFRSLLSHPLRNSNEELLSLQAELLQLAPQLKKISAPTIIIHGTKDNLVPFENLAYIQTQLTQVRRIKTMVLENQNHFLPWNSEPAVREAIAWAIEQTC
jgi:pimeloyl-ACP methyl ester carboxylesterase